MAAPLWSLSDAQSRESVLAAFRHLQRAHASYLTLVADLDVRPEAVPKARQGTVARTYLRHQLNRTPSQAAADVAAALVLRPDADPATGGLPRLGAALAAGDVSREHVGVAVRALRRIPSHILSEPVPGDGDPIETGDQPEAGGAGAQACGGDLIDEMVTDHARRFDTIRTDLLAQYLLNGADPDGSRSFDPRAAERRGFSIAQDPTGMFVIRGELDQGNGAIFAAMIDHLSKPCPSRTETAEDGTLVTIHDKRTARQRRADALGEMARLAAGSIQAGTRGGEPPRVVIHADIADLIAARWGDHVTPNEPQHQPEPGRRRPTHEGDEGGRPRSVPGPEFGLGGLVDPDLLARFACDSLLQRAMLASSGALLDLGRDVRTVSSAQRRALTARDRGCVIPACSAPASWCEGHHVRWFRDGGRTDIGNLALLCSRHHTEVHQGIWVLTMRDGVPWASPPGWIDPQRRPLRNTYLHDAGVARDLGIQLRLGFDPPDRWDRPGPPDSQDPPPLADTG